ncbi:hypothetical protein T10_4601 [Trichinella papuae]|nr:hypothetical protein T10_4601 [Trichinella papuae]
MRHASNRLLQEAPFIQDVIRNHIGVFSLLLRIPRKPVFQGSESFPPVDWKWGGIRLPLPADEISMPIETDRFLKSDQRWICLGLFRRWKNSESFNNPEMLQQFTEVVFSRGNQGGHLPSDGCLTVGHQMIQRKMVSTETALF